MPSSPTGWVALTDESWYRFLLQQQAERGPLDEVNFWLPKDLREFRAIAPGSPFFFKLKSPHLAVAGFGYFARASKVPLSLMWEAFEKANGAPDFGLLRERLLRLRKEPLRPGADPTINCLMVAEPVFFEPGDWVDPPQGWKKHIQQGKTYALDGGEGLRLWEACHDRAGLVRQPDEGDGLVVPEGPRYGKPVLRRVRMGQGTFSIAVRDAWGRACAVTREHSLPVLDAAHIVPYSRGGEHSLGNGLCLRADIHRLFDKGFVTVDPDLRFRVSPRLRDEWKNGRVYYDLDGHSLATPAERGAGPDRDLLDWHGREVFLGD